MVAVVLVVAVVVRMKKALTIMGDGNDGYNGGAYGGGGGER